MREIKTQGIIPGTMQYGITGSMPLNDKGDKPCLGRIVRRARNAVKRYAGKTEPKLVRRYEHAQAILLAHKLSEGT